MKQKESHSKDKTKVTDTDELARCTLRQRIRQGYASSSCQFDEERKSLYDVMHRTAVFGESNSMLLTGPRGGGKTTLIRSVLDELMSKPEVKDNLILVQLNGLLQTDDKIALKEITRQLHLDNVIGDRVFGSFAETLQFMLDALKSGGHESKCIMFVLEEFDLFAQHRNQTLLYNLFDVSQSAQTPICVIGVTCRLDVIELLEKRVKSRFSHRQIHLFTRHSFEQFTAMFVDILSLPENFCDRKFAAKWNKDIKALSSEASIVEILKRQYQCSKEVRDLQKFVTYPICQLSTEHPRLLATDFIEAVKLRSLDSKSAMLKGLSILELCLVIAMKHLTEIYEGEPFNFEMVYNEYQKFSKSKSSMQHFERPVVLKAFEHLLALELVRPIDGSGSKTQKHYRLMSMLIHPSQITDVLQKYSNCSTDIKHWACQSILTT